MEVIDSFNNVSVWVLGAAVLLAIAGSIILTAVMLTDQFCEKIAGRIDWPKVSIKAGLFLLQTVLLGATAIAIALQYTSKQQALIGSIVTAFLALIILLLTDAVAELRTRKEVRNARNLAGRTEKESD